MEEIGCHFKFEKIIGNIYHDTNLLLSSGRNCLKYIINERNITTLYIYLAKGRYAFTFTTGSATSIAKPRIWNSEYSVHMT